MEDNIFNSPAILNDSDIEGGEKKDQLKIASDKLNKKSTQLVKKIVKEDNVQDIQDLTHLFNLNHSKKQILRTMVYDDLLDGITEQMKERVKERANNFSNKDLIDFMKTVTDSMEKAQKQIGAIDTTPIIQINQQNNYINSDEVGGGLDRESKQKVAKLAQMILNQAKNGGLILEDELNSEDELYNASDNNDDETIVYEEIKLENDETLLNSEEDNL